MRHVSEAALPHYGRSVIMLVKVFSRAVAVLSEDGVSASCAAMPCCAFSVFPEGLDLAFHVRGPALPAALRHKSPRCWNGGEFSVAHSL